MDGGGGTILEANPPPPPPTHQVQDDEQTPLQLRHSHLKRISYSMGLPYFVLGMLMVLLNEA
jgi:hypothetical protein